MYEQIKDLFFLSKKNKFCSFLTIFALHICTLNNDFKSELDWFLFGKYGIYDLTNLLIFGFFTLMVILVCVKIITYGLFHLFFAIEFNNKYPAIDKVGNKYLFLLDFGDTAGLLIFPSLLVIYFLSIIMSVHQNWDYSLTYFAKLFSTEHQIALVLSLLPFGILWLYNKRS
ncbi:hypothetical protein [Ruminococcus sp.]|uniref:hypothetical protein n=1 Tax=Ruminococcus sp. TaxID=41978 RepID=UPI0025E826B5|nr:hypothetical protein [Ruminococcus sp.]